MPDNQQTKLAEFFKFIENAPADEKIIAMDCNDHCEKLASLAEQVANGAELDEILPELNEHMQYWGDCREEFLALVAVLRAEQDAHLRDALRDMESTDNPVIPDKTS
jgi:hypothetical protein